MGDPAALAIVVGMLLATAAVTWMFGRLVGRRVARRHPTLALATTTLFVPACFLLYGIVLFRVEGAAHPTSDWPAMALLSGMVFAGLSLMASVPAAFATLDGGRRRS